MRNWWGLAAVLVDGGTVPGGIWPGAAAFRFCGQLRPFMSAGGLLCGLWHCFPEFRMQFT